MADYGPKDFEAISADARKSPEFKKMTGDDTEPDADLDEGGEGADLRAAFASAQSQDEDGFVANMLSAIKTCVANYGNVKK